MKHFLIINLIILTSSALAQGPYSLIIRTPSATLGIDQNRPLFIDDCKQQRNLDEQGFQQIEQLSGLLAGWAQPATPIFSSEYCRSSLTAKAVFPNNDTMPLEALNDACFSSAIQNRNNLQTFKSMMESAVQNQVFVAHNCNIRMIFHEVLFEQCDGVRRLEAAQWMLVDASDAENIRIVQCPQ